MASRARPIVRLTAWTFAAAVVVILAALGWGGDLLIASGPRTGHVDAAVVLEGSIVGYQARLAGGMALAERGAADRVLLLLPRQSYWGEFVFPVARAYLERTWGSDLAARVDFCEMGPEVDSTAEESEAALSCIEAHHWRRIAVVTSNYHTRRAGILWRRAVMRHDPALELSVEGVADPEFQEPWWRHRRAAKIWLGESEKLIWTVLGG